MGYAYNRTETYTQKFLQMHSHYHTVILSSYHFITPEYIQKFGGKFGTPGRRCVEYIKTYGRGFIDRDLINLV
jgi:hypothetical protein